MRKTLAIVSILFVLVSPTRAKADLFGGDVVVLTQILAQAIKQLVELRSILNSAKENVSLIRDINRGIDQALQLAVTISPNRDPGLYKELRGMQEALTLIETVYGAVTNSPHATSQHKTDQAVAEAIALNNSIYEYSNKVDEIGEAIKVRSNLASPGGAQRLSAQSLGVILHVMNQTLRTQATGLKLQAQALEIQNKKDKEQTQLISSSAHSLRSAMESQKPQFALPNF